jgi:hypothetical protein
MMRKYLISLSIVITSLSAFGQTLAPKELKFELVVPTDRNHWRPDRAGTSKLQFRSVPFREMSKALKVCKQEGMGGLFP